MSASAVARITALETLIVGAASLVGGLALGIALSQGLAALTASLFVAEVPGVSFGVSAGALGKTLAAFAAIFAVCALANMRTVARARLVDLMHSEAKSERLALRSIPLSFALFVVACVIIGISYKLLVDNGLTEFTPQFGAATVLVCLGTALFFYSLAGFLLRLLQLVRPVYLRGLNMFALRQLSSRVNTAFVSMSVVCITLFLAITSVCGGIGICNTLSAGLARTTAYDVSVRTVVGSYSAETGFAPVELGSFGEFAASVSYDMEEGLRQSARALDAGDLDELVSATAQVHFYVDTQSALSMGDFDKLLGRPLSEYAGASISDGYASFPVYLVALSEVNDALALAGADPIELGEGQCAVIADSDIVADYWRDLVDTAPVLSVGDARLALSAFRSDCLETTMTPLNTGAIVVPDEALPESAQLSYILFDAQCPSEEATEALGALVGAIAETNEPDTWPITMSFTKEEVEQQSIQFSAIVAYLAVYIGFVLVMACAAILAIQQLSEASDNAARYGLLRKLGASERMVSRALLVQIAVYFAFPLALALAHSVCALAVVADVVALFGHLDIGQMALMCAGAFLVVYGAYFALTYAGARRFALGS